MNRIVCYFCSSLEQKENTLKESVKLSINVFALNTNTHTHANDKINRKNAEN